MRQKPNRHPFTALVGTMALLVSALATNATLALAAPSPASASTPTSATDETKVPHYFGPYPNWANSPLTMATAEVTIAGGGTGAAAVAQVDPGTGGVTRIDVTSPGHDYAAGTTTVTVDGTSGTPAAATATVTTTGGVVAAAVDNAGSGYGKFQVDVVVIPTDLQRSGRSTHLHNATDSTLLHRSDMYTARSRKKTDRQKSQVAPALRRCEHYSENILSRL